MGARKPRQMASASETKVTDLDGVRRTRITKNVTADFGLQTTPSELKTLRGIDRRTMPRRGSMLYIAIIIGKKGVKRMPPLITFSSLDCFASAITVY